VAKELRVTIVGDSTALQAALARASGATAGFAGSVNRVGSSVASTGKTLTRHLTLPIVALGALAGKAAVDFQNSMELLHTQAGIAQGSIDGLSKSVLKLAGPTATAPEELAAGLYHLSSQGLRGASAIKALQIAAEGAKMGQANLEDVTNALGAVLSSGIHGVRNYGQAMGELNATVGAGDMRMQDLADAMGTGLPAKAAVAGVSLRDVGAALAVFGDNNIRGAEAGTLLNSTMRLMEAPSGAAAKAMAKVGLSAEDLGNTLRGKGLVAAVEMLRDHLSSLSKEGQAMALTHMFGGRQSGGVQILIDQLGRLKTKVKEVDDGGASFAKNWNAYTQTTAYHLASMGASMKAAGVNLGDILLPVISELTNKIGGLVQRFDGLSDSTKKIILVAAGVAAALGPVLSLVGNGIKLFGGLAEGIGFLAANPLALAIVALVALGAAIAAAVLWPDKMRDVLERMGLSAQHASTIISDLQQVFAVVKAAALAFVGAVQAVWARFGDVILAQARTDWNLIKGVIQGALNVIRGVVNIITGLMHGDWSRVWQGIKQVLSGEWQIMKSVVTAALQTMRNQVVAVGRLIESALRALWSAAKADASSAWHGIESAVVTAVTALVNKVVAYFKALPGRIKAAFGDAKSVLFSVGAGIVEGLLAGIESQAGGLLAKAHSLASSVTGAFKSAFHINSPSKLMAKEVGEPISEGIGYGIEQGSGLATSKAAKVAAEAVAKARQAVIDGRSGLISAFGQLANDALNAFDQKVQAYVSPAAKLLAKMQGQDQVTGAQRSVDQAQGQLGQAQAALAGAAPGTDTQSLVDQVTQAQQALSDAIRAQKELELQMEADVEQKKHDRLMAIQRENMAKQLYHLQQELLKHPAEWKKAGVKVESILKKFGVRMVPSGQAWASMFAHGIRQGIPEVEAAAHALATAVDKYMPHSPAKEGPLSRLPNWNALTMGLDSTVAGANASMGRLSGVTSGARPTYGGSAGEVSGDIVLVMDGEVLGRASRKYLNRKGERNVRLTFGGA
jgi:TP901 family phage tail tape measure protein